MILSEHHSGLKPQAVLSTFPSIEFTYYLATRSHSMTEADPLWIAPIPLSRYMKAEGAVDPPKLTYGDYYSAVRNFLEDRQFKILITALHAADKKSCRMEDIDRVDIFLEKHGQFYHPCRAVVRLKNDTCTFVVNVAVSSYGKNAIEQEFNLLSRLADFADGHFLPQVYGCDTVSLSNGYDVKMFIGEWFEDFHEFHLSREPATGQNKIRVWDGNQTSRFLSNAETEKLYRQIAKIITLYYDPETFGQIHPWHHAAGDFVVCCTGDEIDVRLVTVRNYGALLETSERDDSTILEAMIFFLVNLSIRTRLDRLDGVEDVVWADAPAVSGTIQGFWDGLTAKNPPWDHRFKQFMKSILFSDFKEICEETVDSYHPQAPEISVIRSHLPQHAIDMYESITAFLE